MIWTLCVSKGQGSDEVLRAGDWSDSAVSSSWTPYCLDVAGSGQRSRALRLAEILASEDNVCGRIHLTIWVWSDSYVSETSEQLTSDQSAFGINPIERRKIARGIRAYFTHKAFRQQHWKNTASRKETTTTTCFQSVYMSLQSPKTPHSWTECNFAFVP